MPPVSSAVRSPPVILGPGKRAAIKVEKTELCGVRGSILERRSASKGKPARWATERQAHRQRSTSRPGGANGASAI